MDAKTITEIANSSSCYIDFYNVSSVANKEKRIKTNSNKLNSKSRKYV